MSWSSLIFRALFCCKNKPSLHYIGGWLLTHPEEEAHRRTRTTMQQPGRNLPHVESELDSHGPGHTQVSVCVLWKIWCISNLNILPLRVVIWGIIGQPIIIAIWGLTGITRTMMLPPPTLLHPRTTAQVPHQEGPIKSLRIAQSLIVTLPLFGLTSMLIILYLDMVEMKMMIMMDNKYTSLNNYLPTLTPIEAS